MEKFIDFLFQANPTTQSDCRSQTADGVNKSTNAGQYASSERILAESITFASTTFGVLKVSQIRAPVSNIKLSFPSQKRDPRKHLAPVDTVYLIAEWSKPWLMEEDCKEACTLLCFDGFDFYQGSFELYDPTGSKATLYRIIAGYCPGAITTFVATDECKNLLTISYQTKRLVQTTMTRIPDQEPLSDSSVVPSAITQKIITLAAQQQLMSWSMRSKLLDNLSHIFAAVNEVEAAADRVSKKMESDRINLLQAATKLINTKKEEIGRLRLELEKGIRTKVPLELIEDTVMPSSPSRKTRKTTTQPKAKAKSVRKVQGKGRAKASPHRRQEASAPEDVIAIESISNPKVSTGSAHKDIESPHEELDPFAGFEDDSVD